MRALGDFRYFVRRILFLYAAFMLCRVGFYAANASLLGPLAWGEIPGLLHGALVFDSVSIFYINLPFLFFSLIPFRFRACAGYQTFLRWLFVTVNTLGLAVDIADIIYFPFKLARIAWDDVSLMQGGNGWLLAGQFLREYWYAVLALAVVARTLWVGFAKIGYKATEIKSDAAYYLSQTLLLLFGAVAAVFLIRGSNFAHATFPITIGDASMYAAPEKTPLVLSNPFALIRTIGQKPDNPVYFSDMEVDSIYTPVHCPSVGAGQRGIFAGRRPNIVLVILESFGAAHIKALSDQFAPGDSGYTPFLDSLIGQGYIFRNAYNSGMRSIDALPALWASIPTFKTQFLSLPQSNAPMRALPSVLDGMGYSTAFMHGAVRQSMSFVAFGKAAGVQRFFSREDYQAEMGSDGFDGLWGIWDHKFLPYAADKLGTLPQPFFATIFTLSSHHPYILPEGFEGRYPEGKMPIQKMIAYSDEALRNFFAQVSRQKWFANTVFVITADHGSGADNEKYRQAPYTNAVPLLFYDPSGSLRGDDMRPAQHIDLMPTLLGMLGYGEPYFAFGRDLLDVRASGYAITYTGGVFNAVTDSLIYRFDRKNIVGVYDFRRDPAQRCNLAGPDSGNERPAVWMKAFIQQYYSHIRHRDFLPPAGACE